MPPADSKAATTPAQVGEQEFRLRWLFDRGLRMRSPKSCWAEGPVGQPKRSHRWDRTRIAPDKIRSSDGASKSLNCLVPQEGLEPPTPSLRMRCSTA